MTDQQRAELKRLTAALGPMVANAPRSNEFAAVRVVTKLVQILAQIALQDEAQEIEATDALPAPTHVRQVGLGVVKTYGGKV